MKFSDFLFGGAFIQSHVNFCYYDYSSEKRVLIELSQCRFSEIRYIYCKDNEIYLEFYEDDIEK